MSINSRPQRSEEEILQLAKFFFPAGLPKVLLFGVRGYYLDSIGKKGENDFGVWDDAIFLIVEGKLVKSFNANTDPQKLKKELAQLDEGIYQFRIGKHKNSYDALRAYPEGVRLPCRRQGADGVWYKSFCSYINIHKGGVNDTFSAGCQTIYPTQYSEFIRLTYGAMRSLTLKLVTYVLVDEKTARTILKK